MNEWLSQVYGTDSVSDQEDKEKIAQSELLVKIASEEGFDIDSLSEPELEQLAAELEAQGINLDGEEEESEQETQGDPGLEDDEDGEDEDEIGYSASGEGEEGSEELGEEDMAKLAEADFLGRVMAHSYTQELKKIASHEKTAGAKADAVKGFFKKGWQKTKDVATAKQFREGRADMKTALSPETAKAAKKKRNMGALKTGLAGAGVVGAGALGAKAMFGKKDKSKEASFSEVQEAIALLREVGLLDE